MNRMSQPADRYLIKFLSSSRSMVQQFFEIHADGPRAAIVSFARLVPDAVVVDVYPPALPPEVWRDA
jgi:hypothetical protein